MSRLGWLVATSLRGLWARRVLSFGSLLLTVIAVASAVVGPSYEQTAANSFVISQLRAEPLINTGLTFVHHPSGPDETIDAALASAIDLSAKDAGPSFGAGHAIAWEPLGIAVLASAPAAPLTPSLASAPGACESVRLRGRCPTNPGEIAVLEADAKLYQLHVGSRLNPYGDRTPFVVTAIYRTTSRSDEFWFGPGRLQSLAPVQTANGTDPGVPAPWITPQATISLRHHTDWFVTVDYRLSTPSDLTPGQVAAIGDHTGALNREARNGLPDGLALEAGNVLHSTAHRLLVRRGVARSTVTPAVLSLILVALVLLSRLLSAAMGLRRGELALASLRGYNRRQLWLLGLLEPLLLLLVAAPVGVLLGYLTSRDLATRWLVPGLPVPFALASVLAVVAVVLVTGVVAAIVVRDAVNEPLSAQIAGVRRPGRTSRFLIVVRLALVAAALAALVTAASRAKPGAPDATDLSLPMLLAIAAGLVSGLLVLALAGLWVRWSARRRSLASYVSSRTVRRRREGTLVILPLTAALTIAVFSLGVSMASGTWRASTAATEVGAPLSYPTRLSIARAVGLTHTLDPDGRWLMAAAVNAVNTDQLNSVILPRVVVDAPRLARVATWPAQWTPGLSAADVARELSPQRPSVILHGARLSITVDNHVTGDFSRLGLSVDVLDDTGSERLLNVGPFAPGTSTHTTSIRVCRSGCVLQTISFGGPAALVEAMRGTATIEDLTVDGQAVPRALDAPWRAADSQIGTTTAVTRPPRLTGGHLMVTFRAANSGSYAGISPTDVPAVVPVLWGRLATPVGRLATGSSGTFRIRSVGTSESVPFRGPSGMLIDYAMFARNTSQTNSTSQVFIWARADLPQRVRDGLAAHGLSHADTESSARHLLDEDAFALALRLYVVVTFLVILLALAGLGANLAVQLPARRRDAASLRVVGVRRSSVMIAVVTEFLVVLGAAALAGVASGALAQYLVVRSVTLGFADSEVTPRVLPSFDLTKAVELSGAVLVLLVVVAALFAVLTVRGARTSSLRENAR